MTLEEEMIAKASSQMARDIDREVLWGMLQGIGWTRVLLPNYTGNEQAVEIMCWLEDNCKGSHERYGRDVIFESAKDAMWFILRWGTV
jgi:hypothetical protein